MNREEIIKKAKEKLPDVYTYEKNIVVIPVILKNEYLINNQITPKRNEHYFEVYFEKHRSEINNEVIWRYMRISRP